jgi:hypothetical protein
MKFKYLWKVVTNEKIIKNVVKNMLNSGSGLVWSSESFSSRLLSKNVKYYKMQMCNSACFYGYETWSVRLREEYELGVHVARMRDTRNAQKILVGKYLRDLDRNKCEDDIKMYLTEVGSHNVDRFRMVCVEPQSSLLCCSGPFPQVLFLSQMNPYLCSG